jgi:hypothetical protein
MFPSKENIREAYGEAPRKKGPMLGKRVEDKQQKEGHQVTIKFRGQGAFSFFLFSFCCYWKEGGRKEEASIDTSSYHIDTGIRA